MSNQPAAALPIRISSLTDRHIGRKLRLAGRLLSFDDQNQLLLLVDETNHACLVDISLCIHPLQRLLELLEEKSVFTVVGYWERSKTELMIPILPAFVNGPEIDPHTYLQGILLVPTPDLDLNLWSEGIRTREDNDLHEVHPQSI